MRKAFFEVIETLAQTHKDIYLLTGDLGFRLFDSFRSRYPDRFFDVGVAEANMIGIASGLALCGKKVYCYSIVPFLVMRAFEHIRIDVAYHNLDVRLVGVGGGFTYGLEGITHLGLEDLALMRSLPNMTVVVPADPLEARSLARASYTHHGPIYIRLGKTGEPCVYNNEPDLEIGRAVILKEGKDIAIFATGNMVYICKEVTEMLERQGLSTTLINVHTIKPLDIVLLNQLASTHRAVFSVEEHNISGGLGSALSEVLAEGRFNCIFKRIGIEYDPSRRIVGSADFLRHSHGLTPSGIYSTILDTIKERT